METKLARVVLRPFLGKRQFQPLFQAMYKLSLAGMNVGEGGVPDQSGETWLLRYIRSQLDRSTDSLIVFDVGANVGQFAEGVLKAFPASVRLWSFEPALATFTQLQQKLCGHPNVTVVKAAMGSSEGQVDMYSPAEGSKLASLYQRSSTWEDRASRESVECLTIDSYCRRKDIARIHFLKIDVEGHELEVLRGSNTMLEADRIDFIQFEFSAAHIDSRVFFRDFHNLLKNRYRIYRILQNGLASMQHYKPELELFKRATNYLAVNQSLK